MGNDVILESQFLNDASPFPCVCAVNTDDDAVVFITATNAVNVCKLYLSSGILVSAVQCSLFDSEFSFNITINGSIDFVQHFMNYEPWTIPFFEVTVQGKS